MQEEKKNIQAEKNPLRVRLIDEAKEFQATYKDGKGNTVNLRFNRDAMENNVPPEAEAQVRANMECPFPNVYDVNAEITPEIQALLAQNQVRHVPPGKVAKRVVR
jgi:hypothetical protein